MKEGRGLETVKEKDHIIICGWNQYTENVLIGLTPMVPWEIHRLSSSMNFPWTRSTPSNSSITNIIEVSQGKLHPRGCPLASPCQRKPGSPSLWPTCQAIMPENDWWRTTLTALTIKSIAPQIKTIAELLDSENKPHLRRANVDEIIVRGEHVGSLLASAVNSPGLPRILSNILSLGDSNKFRRVDNSPWLCRQTFRELFLFYREKHHAILIVF